MSNENADIEEWFGVHTMTTWLFSKMLSKIGIVALVLVCLSVGYDRYLTTGNPWMILYAVGLVFPFAIIIFFAMLIALFGAMFADSAINKIFSNPNPKNPAQQLLFFLFSCVGFFLFALLAGAGSPDFYRICA